MPPFSELECHLAEHPATASTYASEGFLAALEQLRQQDATGENVLWSWAPGSRGEPWRCKYKRRSFHTAVDHMKSLAGRTAPTCVILGDSRTERLNTNFDGRLAALLPNAFIHSVGGDGIEHIAFRLQMSFHHCFAQHVRTVVLLAGINNLLPRRREGVEAEGVATEPRHIARAIQQLVAQIHEAAAAAGNVHPIDVVCCHELPVHSSFGDADGVNARVAQLNTLLDQLRRCRVVRTALPTPLCREHYLDDKLHLSEAGYGCLLPQLTTAVPALVAEAGHGGNDDSSAGAVVASSSSDEQQHEVQRRKRRRDVR